MSETLPCTANLMFVDSVKNILNRSGDYVACLGVSEVGSGSDVSSIRSKGKLFIGLS